MIIGSSYLYNKGEKACGLCAADRISGWGLKTQGTDRAPKTTISNFEVSNWCVYVCVLPIMYLWLWMCVFLCLCVVQRARKKEKVLQED